MTDRRSVCRKGDGVDSLPVTPAMQAGVTDHRWSIEKIVDLLPPLRYNTRPKKTKLGLD
jgi:hypothetical protein